MFELLVAVALIWIVIWIIGACFIWTLMLLDKVADVIDDIRWKREHRHKHT